MTHKNMKLCHKGLGAVTLSKRLWAIEGPLSVVSRAVKHSSHRTELSGWSAW